MLRNPQAVNIKPNSFGPSNPKKISNYIYETQRTLGKGNFSTVHQGVNIITNQPIAVKVIRLQSLNCKKLHDLLNQEISILCSLSHHNIIRCHQVLKSANNCYIITELCQQGTLESFLKQTRSFSEEELWPYIRDIYEGLRYLAEQGIIHRDLKVSNIFLKNGAVKIADFGFAVRTRSHFYDLSIGSPLYMAPQGYIEKRYGPKTDVWALGIIVYELLHGRTPFSNCISDLDLKQKMIKGINQDFFKAGLSTEIKELMFRCLTVNQSARISVQQLNSLPIFKKYIPNIKKQGSWPLRPYWSIPIAIQPYQKERQKLQDSLHEMQNPFTSQQLQAVTCLESTKILTLRPYSQTIDKNTKEESVTSTSSNAQESFADNSFIKGIITFNEALGLIHFCRVGFQLLRLLSNEELKAKIKQIIMSILQDILGKITSRSVSFQVPEAKRDKEKKLKTVVLQYIQRYKDFPVKITIKEEINCEHSSVLFKDILFILQEKQNKSKQQVYQMHLLMIFERFCHKFSRRSLLEDYSCFASQKILEECLSDKEKYSSLQTSYELKKKLVL